MPTLTNIERQSILHYFNNDELATNVWLDKYAMKDPEADKYLEIHPSDMIKRLVTELTRIEYKYYLSARRKLLLPWNRNKLSKLGKEYFLTKKKMTYHQLYTMIYDYLYDQYIVLGGSIMASLGTNNYTSLSNCFVIGQPEDSYESVYNKRAEQVQLMKRRGGVGKDLSLLRPKGSKVNNAALTSTGAASFMQVDSEITKEVAMDGRRGALMISMSIDHPDSEAFIMAKDNLSKITAANVSLKVSDSFMKAAYTESDYILKYPINAKVDSISLPTLEYNKLVKLDNGVYIKKVKAHELWRKFIHASWKNAEPGIIYEDSHHRDSPDGVYPEFKGVTTNPCGEIFMQPYDSCRLLHLNLYNFVQTPFETNSVFLTENFQRVSYFISLIADNIIDLEIEAINSIINKLKKENTTLEIELWEKVKQNAINGRRCGIGITAVGDVMAALNIKFGSSMSKYTFRNIMKIKMSSELDAQIDMAILRGPFKKWNRDLEYIKDKTFIGKNTFYETLKYNFPQKIKSFYKYGRRNVSWSTIAPTGSVSILTQTTSGIEPLFEPYYIRNRKVSDGEFFDFTDKGGEKFKKYVVVHEKLKEWWKKQNYIDGYTEITPDNIQSIYEKSPYYKSCTNDIQIIDRLMMQAVAQEYTTHSISSTVNLPKLISEEDVSDLYIKAWEFGLKGITIYRDGSREGILNKINDVTSTSKDIFPQYDAPTRPKRLPAQSYLIKSKGNIYAVIVGLLDDKPYEIFVAESDLDFIQQKGTITKVKKGMYQWVGENGNTIFNLNSFSESLLERTTTLYLSMLLRTGAKLPFVIKVSKKIDGNISSFTSAISRVLSKYIPKEEVYEKCPECGGKLIREAGCTKCTECSYSLCLLAYELKS